MKYITKTIKHLYLLILLALILLPVVYTISSSFKTNMEMLAHPENLFPAEATLDNYRQCIEVGTTFPIVPINKPLNKKIHSLCKGKSYIFEIKAANPFGKLSVNTLRKEITL